MIFRLRKRSSDGGVAAADRPQDVESLLTQVDEVRNGGCTPENAGRILDARHRAGVALLDTGGVESPVDPEPDRAAIGASSVPEIHARHLTPGILRAAMLERGCLLVRELVDASETPKIIEGIDKGYAGRDARMTGQEPDLGYFRELVPDPRFETAVGSDRMFIGQSGAAGLWLADSPLVAYDVVEAFERAGLRETATQYLGERAAISVNKSVLRRVEPDLLGEPSDK